MGPAPTRTPCCDKPVIEDGGPPCIQWNRWTKVVQCQRCGAKYTLSEDDDELNPSTKPAKVKPAPRIRDLTPGDETWVVCEGVLIHQTTGEMWVDPKYSTSLEPVMDRAHTGLCSVLVRKNQKGELVAVEGEKNNTTLVSKDQSTSNAVLPLLWQVG